MERAASNLADGLSDMSATLGFGLPGHGEWLLLLLLGLLIFGKRLPEVGRSLGRGIVEFKRGIKGIEDEIDDESSRPGQVDHASKQSLPNESASATQEQVKAKASVANPEG